MYGQISRALLFADDGTQSKWFHVDNESSGTRFGFTGTAPVNPGLRAGFRIELDLQSNESQLVSFTPAAGTNSPASNFPGTTAGTGFSERHMDAWFEGGWGRVNIGQGDGAANGASESDLSGTGLANGIGVADLGGGFAYRNTTAPAATPPAFGPSIGTTINQQDFESRYDRLLYVTPNFSGFRGQLSWGQSGNADVKEIGVFYGAKMGGLGELAASLGWSEQGSTVAGGTRDETMGGSISWLHGSGLNLTYSYTNREQPTTAAMVAAGTAARESTFNYFKVGFKRGMHAIGVDYAMGDDFAAVGDEAKMYGIGYVFSPVRWVEFTASYKVHQLDRGGDAGTGVAAATYDDVKIASIGTRVRF